MVKCRWSYIHRRTVFTLYTNHSTKQQFVANDIRLSNRIHLFVYIAVGLRWIFSFLFTITTYNQYWLLLEHNTVLLTDTANKILNIKLSLWQTWYKVHSLYISRSVCMDHFHFCPRWINVCWSTQKGYMHVYLSGP